MDIYIAIELNDAQAVKLKDWDLPALLAKGVKDLLGPEVELVDGSDSVRVQVVDVCGVYKDRPPRG